MKIKKYNRYWAVYDEEEKMVCVAVYKKGALEVVRRLTEEREKGKIKVCSVCRRAVKPPLQWWGKPYNACSDCVRKAAVELQEREKSEDTPSEDYPLGGTLEPYDIEGQR